MPTQVQIKNLLIIASLVLFSKLNGQVRLDKVKAPDIETSNLKDSSASKQSTGFKKLATIDLYLLFNAEIDTIHVDTTLSIKKDYKFNYLQKDNFGLMPFANIGQTYNALSFNPADNEVTPLFGSRARHFNYLEQEDIKYYEVPTPWTRLTYKTAFEQGQMLDAFFSVNLSKQINFSIEYKGLRSLGNYQNALTSSGNFRFTSNYKSKNKRYKANGHIVMQDLLNQENGGLLDDEVESFTSGDEDFIDRSVFDMNFDNAESILVGKRFFLNQSYDIIKKNDSINKNSLAIVNMISFEDKYYQYKQTSPANDYFGGSFTSSINDKVTLENFRTSLNIEYYNNIIGDVSFGISYTDVNYGYNGVVLFPDESIPNRVKSNFLGLNASYSKTINSVSLRSDASLNLSDEFVGSYIDSELSMKLNEDILLKGGIYINSKLPNFNYLLYQSDYINYNWYNFEDFRNINTQQLKFSINSDKYLNANLDISNIENYTYFNLNSVIDTNKVIRPEQYNESLQYLRLKLQKEFRFGNFALDNTIMYQSVVSDEDVLNVPDLITRNTLYYSNQIFKKAMTLQTGVTLNYFTKYKMNGYDPLLAEFYTQNETRLGGFPRLDFFINAKVRQTRIFLKAEHFNSAFTGFDYFSAPNHPYRDFTIRFGLVWDFFL
ncbi:putative porin [Winogradskyella flava]|uniref:Putative porin n=1 Tax=Winogradskyella flava TaxID=1884876 RepID=A0A842IXS7_9FLAO|nr:putative porin [Winogradskyella flava]MBC2846506.1 putative porin [Winogradskyella flava]